MNPLLGFAFVLIVFNIWMKRRIDRKIKKSRNEPRWRDQMDKVEYEDEINKLKLKYMTEKPEGLEELEQEVDIARKEER